MNGLLDYQGGESFLHKLNPLTKMALSFALCASCFLNGSPLFILGVILLNYLLAALAGVGARPLRITASLLKLALVLFIVQVLVIRDGRPLLHLPAGFVITREGALFSLVFVMRFIAAALPLALLFSVTRMSDIANALNRGLHIPYKYTFVLTTAMRFIPLFAGEMQAVMEAQIARGVEFDTRNFFRKMRLIIPLCAPLLISSVRKIEGAALSAELRGFSLRKPGAGYKRYPLKAADFAVLGGCVLLCAGAVIPLF